MTRMNRRYSALLLFLLGIVPVTVHPYRNTFQFRHISSQDGLSQNTIYTVLQDSRGFMWFGTQDGLNRYDGYTFTVYNHDPLDSKTLSDNWVLCILEDDTGDLWIGTQNGLNRFDRESERMTRISDRPEIPRSSGHNIVNCIHKGNSGSLWIGTNDGLCEFNPATKTFAHRKQKSTDPRGLSSNSVKAIHEDAQGILWIGTEKGLNRYDRKTRLFKQCLQDAHRKEINVNCIHEDAKNTLWLGTDRGLLLFDPVSQTFTPKLTEHILAWETVVDICEDTSQRLWIGTLSSGIWILDTDTNEVFQCSHNPSDPKSLSLNGIKDLYADRCGCMWIGTNGNGLNTWHPSRQKFAHLKHDPNNPNSLGPTSVRAIHEDRQGNLWIGGYIGLDRYDRKTEQFTHYREFHHVNTTLSNNNVMVICEDPDEPRRRLWIGTEGGGLNSFDLVRQTFQRYPYSPDGSRGLPGRIVYTICSDPDGILWIGTEMGLTRFDTSRETFQLFQQDPHNPNSLSHNLVKTIFLDSSGFLWIGTAGGGLNRFDRKTEACIHYRNDPKNPKSLNNNSILSVCQDKNGTLWIGTNGGGFNKLNKNSETFQHYTKEHGLPNNVVYGIVEDDDGYLWLSTNNGISRFDPEAETFRNYTVEDGLQSNEFNYNAYYKSASGEVFFGGIHGVNAFFPDRIEENAIAPSVVITDFQLFNTPLPIGHRDHGRLLLKQSITETHVINLSHRDNVISFEFAGLHYAAPEQNRYAYKMEGLDKDWNFVGKRRFATYTKLPAGTYTFRVKGSNCDGVWNEDGASLAITITPPFWTTVWFRALGIITILLVIVTAHRTRTRQIRMRSRQIENMNTKLQNEISERVRAEKALRESKERYRSVYNTAPLAFVVWDRECRVTDWNKQAEELFGWTREEILHRNFFEFLIPEKARPHVEDVVQALMREDLPSHSINENLTKTGKTILCEWNNSILRDSEGYVAGAISLALDITERKQLQEQLLQSEKMSALGQMISGIAHELNNPLTGVLGYAQLLLMASDLSQSTKQSLETINREAERAREIVQNLLTFARQHTPEKRRIQINEIVSRVLDLRAYEMKVSNIKVKRTFDENLPRPHADEHQLQQVFMNIVINAEQAMLEAHDHGRLKVTTRWDEAHDTVEVSFTDNGPGIPDKNLSSIFNPFFTTKPVGKGTGLGLSISYGIVQEHGGHIAVTSTPGQGSTFTVRLPVGDVEISEIVVAPPERQHALGIDTKKVLVVDDEPSVVDLIRGALEREGHSVETALNGDAAIRKINVEPFDAVISDLKMPGRGGAHVFLHCKEKKPNLVERFLLVTGDIVAPDSLQFMEKYNIPHLSKPFDLKELISSFNQLFGTEKRPKVQTHEGNVIPGDLR